MNKFFWKKATGLNADIERHRQKEQEINAMIADLEKKDQSDPMVVAALRAYRRFGYQLELSKIEILTKLGRKK